ncbi:uncharacterized protein PHALS_12147 [Plasmopara halstedii]|uniref:RxLR-like protein n=1 Tax=Plasmopara halstedii TaxID=4781 RepID=A0A0P1AL68_PLAHL|nr:uncharacterized protein PHALS_12147 [Plasmopara halstedii]CEG41829.1 hypothetical protein PHALS_12147 [Plasmopara halstedii]|eukprot:XP_024578198.1 hypothetical protein PHALS_12147 [Plasmopara halstedii]
MRFSSMRLLFAVMRLPVLKPRLLPCELVAINMKNAHLGYHTQSSSPGASPYPSHMYAEAHPALDKSYPSTPTDLGRAALHYQYRRVSYHVHHSEWFRYEQNSLDQVVALATKSTN